MRSLNDDIANLASINKRFKCENQNIGGDFSWEKIVYKKITSRDTPAEILSTWKFARFLVINQIKMGNCLKKSVSPFRNWIIVNHNFLPLPNT